jgi:hypothetical protein
MDSTEVVWTISALSSAMCLSLVIHLRMTSLKKMNDQLTRLCRILVHTGALRWVGDHLQWVILG